MKIFKMLLVVLLVGGLSACGNPLDKNLVNQKELVVLSVLNDKVYNSCSANPKEVIRVINKRTSAPIINDSFRDVEYLIKSFDNSLKCNTVTTTIQDLYFKLYGEKLFSDSKVTLEKESAITSELLSAKEIRELTATVKTCNIAKVKVISLLDQNNLLTIDDKNVIEKLVLRCESDKLLQELNN
jgi:hypothetical protein